MDTDTPSADHHHHPISDESCKKARTIADTTTTTTTNVGDFISGLPDAILCDILSYIPTKYAVATSVLSKRWNRVWTSVPNLDFSDWSVYSIRTPVYETHFLNFVDRVLSLNNVSRVRKVHVHCNEGCDSSRVNAWMNAVVSRDCKYFNISLPKSCLVKSLDQNSLIHLLPSSFFASKNFVQLWLENIALKVPASVHFPCLETMYLHSVQLLDDVSLKNLLSGCPVLRTLSMSRATWDNALTLFFCSSTLHSLTLFTSYCDRDFGYKVVLDTPNLTYLSLSDGVDADYDIIDLSSLVKAKVGVDLEEDGRVQTDGDVFNARLFELLRKISHVEDICFSTRIMNSFRYTFLENLPIFNNLTCMKVELVSDCWSILPYLFHYAPNLVTFVLEKEDVHPDCGWYNPNDVPQCFSSTLQNVEINDFEDCDEEMGMIDYFLTNAMVLKRLSINSFDIDLEKETNILKNLLIIPRISSTCQIEYRNCRF